MKCRNTEQNFTLAEAGRCSLNPGHRRPSVAPAEDEHGQHDDGEHAANRRPAPSLGVGELLCYLLRLHGLHEQLTSRAATILSLQAPVPPCRRCAPELTFMLLD